MPTPTSPAATGDRANPNPFLREALIANDPARVAQAFAEGAVLPRKGREHPVFAWLEAIRHTGTREDSLGVLRCLLEAGLPADFQVRATGSDIQKMKRDAGLHFMVSVPRCHVAQGTVEGDLGAPLLDRLLEQRQSEAARELLGHLPATYFVSARGSYGRYPAMGVAIQAGDWSTVGAMIERIETEGVIGGDAQQAIALTAAMARACDSVPEAELPRMQWLAQWIGRSAQHHGWDGLGQERRAGVVKGAWAVAPKDLDRWLAWFPDDEASLWQAAGAAVGTDLWPILLDRVVATGTGDRLWRRVMDDPHTPEALHRTVHVLRPPPYIRHAKEPPIALSPLDYLVLAADRVTEEDGEVGEAQKTVYWNAAIDELIERGAVPLWKRRADRVALTYAQLFAMDAYRTGTKPPAEWWASRPAWPLRHPISGRGPLHESHDVRDLDYWVMAGDDLLTRHRDGRWVFADVMESVVNRKKGKRRDGAIDRLVQHLKREPRLWEQTTDAGLQLVDLACSHKKLFEAMRRNATRTPSIEAARVAISHRQTAIFRVLLGPSYAMDPAAVGKDGLGLRGQITYAMALENPGARAHQALRVMDTMVSAYPLDPPEQSGRCLRLLVSAFSVGNHRWPEQSLSACLRAQGWGDPKRWRVDEILGLNRLCVIESQAGGDSLLGMSDPPSALAMAALKQLLHPDRWGDFRWPTRRGDVGLFQVARAWLKNVEGEHLTVADRTETVALWKRARSALEKMVTLEGLLDTPAAQALEAEIERMRLETVVATAATPNRASGIRL